jgi:hypothetical protein
MLMVPSHSCITYLFHGEVCNWKILVCVRHAVTFLSFLVSTVFLKMLFAETTQQTNLIAETTQQTNLTKKI